MASKKEQMVKKILDSNPSIKINYMFLKEEWVNFSLDELKIIDSLVMEPTILKSCKQIWETGNSQKAYDYFLQYENIFAAKIELADKLIKDFPHKVVSFFGDEYPLEDIDPIELALCYTSKDLEELMKMFDKKYQSKFDYQLEIAINSTSNEPNEKDMKKEEKARIRNASKIYKLVDMYQINYIKKPLEYNFNVGSISDLEQNYSAEILQEIIDAIESDEYLEPPEVSQTIFDVAEEIFIIAAQKGIKFLREPLNINFELDDVEDIVNNYSPSDIQKTLLEIRKFESTLDQQQEMFNTLEVARKYLNGKAPEVEEEESWYQYVPKYLEKEIASLSLENAYQIVLSTSKKKNIDEKMKKEVMDYRFYLEELIFGERKIFHEEAVKAEFQEYPFEEYVRQTVEAIILPHVEVLAKIVESNGNIQFVNVWSQNFNGSLKEEVKVRDNYKCVICDEETNLHVHHKIPRKYGGVNHKDNLVTLCASCHGAVETADFEHAYNKCMVNAIKGKTSLQKPIDLNKDLYLLKAEVKQELDNLFLKMNIREEVLAGELLHTMKKINYIFEN